jgi:hypothetical protein
MKLTNHILIQTAGAQASVIFETTQGTDELDPFQLRKLIDSLKKLYSEINYKELSQFLSELESKVEARLKSTLTQQLGINIPVADQGKSQEYWWSLREMIRLAKQQWEERRDPLLFQELVTNWFNEHSKEDTNAYTRFLERRMRTLEAERQLCVVQRNKLEEERNNLRLQVQSLHEKPQ